MFNIELMKERVLEIADPNNPYSQEDFNEEFSMGTIALNPNAHKVQFSFKNESSNPNPEYATNGSSGFDLRANLTDDVKIKSGDVAIVPTGLYFKIPENFEIQIRSRSGLASKNGVVVLNSPGTIDADYRGEIKVILINHGKETFTIQHGDRIAQAVVASVFAKNVVHLLQVDNVSDDTERGSGGFGSTGLK